MADEMTKAVETVDNTETVPTESNGAGQGNVDGDGATGTDAGSMSFDELLKSNRDYQAEFDRRVNKATSTAVNNAKEKWELITNEKVSEADKLARMTAREREQYDLQKREKALARREAEIEKKELQASAKNTLAELELPADLSEVLDYSSAEACKRSITALNDAFQNAVSKAVTDRLKNAEPPKKAPENKDTEKAAMREQIEAAMRKRL